MLLDLFSALSSMLSSSPMMALFGAFLWGIAGILLSPCHLAGIPLIVGFIDIQGEIRTGRAALISTLFSAGILISIAIIGVATGLAGRIMGDIGKYGDFTVAVLMVMIGFYLLGIVSIPYFENGADQPGIKKKGFKAAFFLGLFFGLALGPCSFAYMAPMLGVAFTVASSNFLYAVALVGAYAVGHCLVIIMAGTSSGVVQHLLQWNEKSKGAEYLKKICGVLVVISGIYMAVNSILN